MIRENGFYWVDVMTDHSLVREVAQWSNNTWYVCGFQAEDEIEDAEFVILNVNETQISE